MHSTLGKYIDNFSSLLASNYFFYRTAFFFSIQTTPRYVWANARNLLLLSLYQFVLVLKTTATVFMLYSKFDASAMSQMYTRSTSELIYTHEHIRMHSLYRNHKVHLCTIGVYFDIKSVYLGIFLIFVLGIINGMRCQWDSIVYIEA